MLDTIAELKTKTACTKDFKCEKNEFNELCAAKPTPGRQFVECLEKNYCSLQLHFGNTNFCRCPLRVYLVMNHAAFE